MRVLSSHEFKSWIHEKYTETTGTEIAIIHSLMGLTMRINYWEIDSTKKALYWCSQHRWLILNTAFAGKNVIKVKTQIVSQFPS